MLAGDPRNEVSGGLFAQGAADLLERVWRLPLGMQGRARSAADGLPPEHRLDSVQLLVISDRWETHHLPRLRPARQDRPSGHARGEALVQAADD